MEVDPQAGQTDAAPNCKRVHFHRLPHKPLPSSMLLPPLSPPAGLVLRHRVLGSTVPRHQRRSQQQSSRRRARPPTRATKTSSTEVAHSGGFPLAAHRASKESRATVETVCSGWKEKKCGTSLAMDFLMRRRSGKPHCLFNAFKLSAHRSRIYLNLAQNHSLCYYYYLVMSRATQNTQTEVHVSFKHSACTNPGACQRW